MDIVDIFSKLGEGIIDLLPRDPFIDTINALDNIEFLNTLNWFFPIDLFIKITLVWLTSVTIFYLYSVILRWLKIIGD